mmetsp:Transcript_112382/g.198355  ORF Transcript_112382/g.198355 Transcript_112382/m.198355 type:complete len:216 (-) Transcript_112382:70-717(-)
MPQVTPRPASNRVSGSWSSTSGIAFIRVLGSAKSILQGRSVFAISSLSSASEASSSTNARPFSEGCPISAQWASPTSVLLEQNFKRPASVQESSNSMIQSLCSSSSKADGSIPLSCTSWYLKIGMPCTNFVFSFTNSRKCGLTSCFRSSVEILPFRFSLLCTRAEVSTIFSLLTKAALHWPSAPLHSPSDAAIKYSHTRHSKCLTAFIAARERGE